VVIGGAFLLLVCREKFDPDQVPPDYMALLSLAFGIMGLMLKVSGPIAAWCSHQVNPVQRLGGIRVVYSPVCLTIDGALCPSCPRHACSTSPS
jgi:hypothetical protein